VVDAESVAAGVKVGDVLPLREIDGETVSVREALADFEALGLCEVLGDREVDTESVPKNVIDAEREGEGVELLDFAAEMDGVGMLE